MPGQVTSYFTFHVYFRGQRFKSRPVPCACEPEVDEGFLLELHKDGAGKENNSLILFGMLKCVISICSLSFKALN